MTLRDSPSRSPSSHLSDGTVMRLYLRDIARYKPLSCADESQCAVLIRAGDDAALEKLIRANLRFVISVANNYQNQGMLLADLINEGNLGLVRAAKRFDERKNFRFISYAVRIPPARLKRSVLR
jgi:RNA polymerase primary sigma factor